MLKNLEIILPSKTSFSEPLVELARRFPQLGLSDSSSLKCLEEEFLDYILSPSDLPSIQAYSACDSTKKACAGRFGWEIGPMKTFSGEARFPNLYKLLAGLLSIPASNADSERGFSTLRKIQTDERASLNHSIET